MRRFTLRPEHIKLLRRGNVDWNEGQSGAAGLDTKRPYGNSDVIRDVAEILGVSQVSDEDGDWEDLPREVEEYVRRTHRETETALSVMLRAGTFEPGEYESDDYQNNWRRVGRVAPDATRAANMTMLDALKELVDIVEGVVAGDVVVDSFTTQPARAAIAKAEGTAPVAGPAGGKDDDE